MESNAKCDDAVTCACAGTGCTASECVEIACSPFALRHDAAGHGHGDDSPPGHMPNLVDHASAVRPTDPAKIPHPIPFRSAPQSSSTSEASPGRRVDVDRCPSIKYRFDFFFLHFITPCNNHTVSLNIFSLVHFCPLYPKLLLEGNDIDRSNGKAKFHHIS